MRRLLLSATALIALGSSLSYASSPIRLELGGSALWLFGLATQDGDVRRDRDFSSTDIKGNNFLNVHGSTVLDNGMKVGFSALFRAGGNSSRYDDDDDIVERSYVYAEGRLGRLMLGTVDQAPKMMHVSAPDAAGLGEDADLGLLSGRWVVAPPSLYYLGTTKIDTGDRTEKITYFTPRFSGFSIGVSFAPGTSSSHWQDSGNRDLGTANETYSAGLNYEDTFNDVTLRASLGWQFSNQFNADLVPGRGEFGNPGLGGGLGGKTGEYNDYSAGLQASFSGFTLGGAVRYRDINRSGFWRSVDQFAWTIGAQYDFDKRTLPLSVSLNYFDVQSKLKPYATPASFRDKTRNVNLSGRYELGTGVDLVGTVGYVNYKVDNIYDTDNDGVAVLTGLSLNF